MTFLIGQEACHRCGLLKMVVTDGAKRDSWTCDTCGGVTSVDVWFPCAYWPEVECQVIVDAERQRLHLPCWIWPVRVQ